MSANTFCAAAVLWAVSSCGSGAQLDKDARGGEQGWVDGSTAQDQGLASDGTGQDSGAGGDATAATDCKACLNFGRRVDWCSATLGCVCRAASAACPSAFVCTDRGCADPLELTSCESPGHVCGTDELCCTANQVCSRNRCEMAYLGTASVLPTQLTLPATDCASPSIDVFLDDATVLANQVKVISLAGHPVSDGSFAVRATQTAIGATTFNVTLCWNKLIDCVINRTCTGEGSDFGVSMRFEFGSTEFPDLVAQAELRVVPPEFGLQVSPAQQRPNTLEYVARDVVFTVSGPPADLDYSVRNIRQPSGAVSSPVPIERAFPESSWDTRRRTFTFRSEWNACGPTGKWYYEAKDIYGRSATVAWTARPTSFPTFKVSFTNTALEILAPPQVGFYIPTTTTDVTYRFQLTGSEPRDGADTVVDSYITPDDTHYDLSAMNPPGYWTGSENCQTYVYAGTVDPDLAPGYYTFRVVDNSGTTHWVKYNAALSGP